MRAQDWLLLILLSTLWGTTLFFVAVANPYVPPLTLVLGRVGIAALVLVCLSSGVALSLPGSVVGMVAVCVTLPSSHAGWSPPAGDEIARQPRDLAWFRPATGRWPSCR